MSSFATGLVEWIKNAKIALAAFVMVLFGLGARIALYYASKSASPPDSLAADLWGDIALAFLTTGLVGVIYEFFIRAESDLLLTQKIRQELGQVVGHLGFEHKLLRAIKASDRHYRNYSVGLYPRKCHPPVAGGFNELHIDLSYTVVFRTPRKVPAPKLMLTSSPDRHQSSLIAKEFELSWLCRLLKDSPHGESIYKLETLKLDGEIVPLSRTEQVLGASKDRVWTYKGAVPARLKKAAVSEYKVEVSVVMPIDAAKDYLFYSLEQCADGCRMEFDWSAIDEIEDVVPIPMIGSPTLEMKDIDVNVSGQRVRIDVNGVSVPHTGVTIVWKRRPAAAIPAIAAL